MRSKSSNKCESSRIVVTNHKHDNRSPECIVEQRPTKQDKILTTSFVTISNVNLSPCTPIKIILGISTLLFDHELGNLSQAPNRKLCDTVFDPVIGDGSSILYCSKSSTEEIFQFKLSIMLQYKFNFLKLSKATPLQNRFYMKRMWRCNELAWKFSFIIICQISFGPYKSAYRLSNPHPRQFIHLKEPETTEIILMLFWNVATMGEVSSDFILCNSHFGWV